MTIDDKVTMAGTSAAGLTPSQTVGPFFHYGLTPGAAYAHVPVSAHHQLVEPDAPGRIVVTGQVFDGAGAPVPDAMIEIWQADAEGRYAPSRTSNRFRGFGRSDTGADGTYRFETLKPGPVPGPGGQLQAPHILIAVFGRGMLKQLQTRLYFAGDPANAADPILALVPEDRRPTLLAQPDGDTWRLDIRLQGENETVFFDV